MNRRVSPLIAIALLLALVAILGHLLSPSDGLAINLDKRLLAPNWHHPLGTDEFGRDVFSRILLGAGTSFFIAGTTVFLALSLGMMIGTVSAYIGGWVDRGIMAANDVFLAFPSTIIALSLLAIMGPGPTSLVLGLTVAYIPVVVRLSRSIVLSVRHSDYVHASLMMRNSHLYTIGRHVIPNSIGPMFILGGAMFGWVILSESSLSFLGLGVPAPAPTWGNMLAASRAYLHSAPWLSIFPGICITTVLLFTNIAGDRMRDRYDPRLPSNAKD
ncbi:peptide/nickel transport system permease protein [Rhizobium sp. PP-F2F-G38]|nr:peptide/nickel transport system permease protein [Rhizobium sp. PP-WC-1G-195]PYE92722.1 peptide/nickel transport system permease protein [Rhizobium sp. PP-F2F-G38]TCP77243.1 peptide/nickel transport system permease protein [Rhizobium sp. PP-CC-2G-626]TCQ03331.1 peptide/nickel transport system permease protein [Rhizobium sp. PP-F2F-G36]